MWSFRSPSYMIAGRGNGQLATDERLKMKFDNSSAASCRHCSSCRNMFFKYDIAVSHGSCFLVLKKKSAWMIFGSLLLINIFFKFIIIITLLFSLSSSASCVSWYLFINQATHTSILPSNFFLFSPVQQVLDLHSHVQPASSLPSSSSIETAYSSSVQLSPVQQESSTCSLPCRALSYPAAPSSGQPALSRPPALSSSATLSSSLPSLNF